jgi:hypothetical protein
MAAPEGAVDNAALLVPEQAAEKLDSVTSAAKAFTDSRAFTAALKSAAPPKTRVFPQPVKAYPDTNLIKIFRYGS